MTQKIFADSSYWIALLHPGDELHEKALNVSQALRNVIFLTSEMVLVEVLNAFSKRGAGPRTLAVDLVETLRSKSDVILEPQTESLFREALGLYGKSADKAWSVTDCASFILMKRHDVIEALTHDHHFQQAGFRILLRDGPR